jgi:hypothetical protein
MLCWYNPGDFSLHSQCSGSSIVDVCLLSCYLRRTVGHATGNRKFNPFGTLVNYGNRLGHPTPPAFDPLFFPNYCVYQAIDLASE